MCAKTLLTIDQLEVPSASYLHNRIRDELMYLLQSHLRNHKSQGTVVSEQWFRLAADTVRAPDVALISPPQIALLDPERRIQAFAPALAVEITSPSNTFDELARKTRQYLGAGSRSVWILVPPMREIHVYTSGAHPAILSAEDSLEDPVLLPGFSARVGDLFEI